MSSELYTRTAEVTPPTPATLPIKRSSGGGEGGPLRTLQRGLDIHDYLDATADSARRTRTVTLAMVVASALIFVAWMNSRQGAWMSQRIDQFNQFSDDYVGKRIGPPDTPAGTTEYRKIRYAEFYAALAKNYVDNSFYIRAPFFGFAVDANDLGTVGGLAFGFILALYYFCLSRESENLAISLEHVRGTERLFQFYTLLSMRQVFTLPKTSTVSHGRLARHVPKLIWTAPFVVHLIVTVNDFQSRALGSKIDVRHTTISSWFNIAFLLLIAAISGLVIWKMGQIDVTWDEFWNEAQKRPNVVPRRDPSLTGWQRTILWVANLRARAVVRQFCVTCGVTFGLGLMITGLVLVSGGPSQRMDLGALTFVAGVLTCVAAYRRNSEMILLAVMGDAIVGAITISAIIVR